MPCPTWITSDNLPQKLEQRATLRIDPDAAMWDEMELGNIWVELWGEKFEAAPPYVCDSNVRLGIKKVLLLDRIAEERQRLALETQSHKQEIIQQLLAVYIAIGHVQNHAQDTVEKQFASSLCRQLELLVLERDSLEFDRESGLLWLSDFDTLLNFLQDGLPLNRLIESIASGSGRQSAIQSATGRSGGELPFPSATANHVATLPLQYARVGSSGRQSAAAAKILSANLTGNSSSQRNIRAIVFNLPDEDADGDNDSADGGNNELQDGDSEDEEDIQMGDAIVNAEQALLRGSASEEQPHFHLAQISHRATQGAWEDEREDDNPFWVWAITSVATAEGSFARALLPQANRLSNRDAIPAKDLTSLDRNRQIKASVLTSYLRWLQAYLDSHPVTQALPSSYRPKIWVVDTDLFHLPGDTLVRMLGKPNGERQMELLDMDAWTIPMWSSKCKTWVLGVIDLRRAVFWYIDSVPGHSQDKHAQYGEWTWDVLIRFYYCVTQFLGQQPINGGIRHMTVTVMVPRAAAGVDSRVWVAADVEAWLLGYKYAPTETDISRYRLRMRHHVFNLPEVPLLPPARQPRPLATTHTYEFAWELCGYLDIQQFSRDYHEEVGEWRWAAL
ncbi:hypothetical protein M422DRAFT_266404 [Sphaerobolus stellatus SS14]|uniref:Uncharacterized protein n=1 Tax=Sphaerobolus stellatus (strain SS14) TaxID=990650 RepID=A0A0C9V389_SPHS4|nr:hypothetical protein M422DRAFT_266404 [Sphaerobolus stellatus SS14]